jgi:hypothetical protein
MPTHVTLRTHLFVSITLFAFSSMVGAQEADTVQEQDEHSSCLMRLSDFSCREARQARLHWSSFRGPF